MFEAYSNGKLIQVSRYFLIIFLCFLQLFCKAQSFESGCYGSLVTSQVSGDNLAGYHKPGGSIGLFVFREISDKALIRLDLSYVMKGSRKAMNPAKGDYDFYVLKLNYLEIPLYISYKFKPKLNIMAGPAIGALTSWAEEDEFGQITPVRPFNRVEVSCNAGINYELSEKIQLGAMANNSILKIRDHSSGAAYRLNRGQYNSALYFMIQYIFGR